MNREVYTIVVDMAANIGGKVKRIQETFCNDTFSGAINFAQGYAEAMNWACPMIHDCTFRNGFVWCDRQGNVLVKVVDSEGNIVKPETR